MDCSICKQHIYSYIDGELDTKTSLLIDDHLLTCPLCSLEFDQEKKIDNLIRRNIPREEAPYALKEAILSRIEECGETKVSLVSKPVLAGIVIAGALFFSLFMLLNKPFPVFSESIKDHIKFLHGNISIDIVPQTLPELQRQLQAQLDFKVTVPDLTSHDVRLLGARICSLKDKKVAYIMYEKNGHAISVFMFDAQELTFPKAKKLSVNNKIFYLCKKKGYNSALWIEGEIACVFVSDLDEAELIYLASM